MNRPDDSTERAPLKLLFVCTGNTCRSPMAEVLARRIAARRNLPDLEVRSAGSHTPHGLGASQGALRAALRHGLTLEDHSSTPLTPELVAWADLILAMGPGHLIQVDMLGGGHKAMLLGAFATRGGSGVEGEALAVPDPFGGDDEIYEETFLTLEKYVELAMKRMAEESETDA